MIMEAELQVLGNADHHMIVNSGPFLEPLTVVIQEVLVVERCGLAVSPRKVEVIVCTGNYKWNRKCLLKIGRKQLSYKNSAKYLSVILDKGMLEKEHLEYK